MQGRAGIVCKHAPSVDSLDLLLHPRVDHDAEGIEIQLARALGREHVLDELGKGLLKAECPGMRVAPQRLRSL